MTCGPVSSYPISRGPCLIFCALHRMVDMVVVAAAVMATVYLEVHKLCFIALAEIKSFVHFTPFFKRLSFLEHCS